MIETIIEKQKIEINDSLIVESPFMSKRTFSLNFKSNSISFLEEYSYFFKRETTENGLNIVFNEPFFLAYPSSGYMLCNGIPTKEVILINNSILEFMGHKFIFRKRDSIENGVDLNDLKIESKNFLIFGESGTGKTSMAKKIHSEIDKSSPFVHLNLSAVPEGLIESTLFGHKKGAFTGAVQDEMGAIEKAKGGFLYLDELDSLSKSIQIKLLLSIEGNSYYRLGEFRPRSVDCRFIFSSSTKSNELLNRGIWRSDFYYRVTSSEIIKLSPLRENTNLIASYLEKFEVERGVFISKKLKTFYLRRTWPGNYREISTHLERKLRHCGKGYWCYDKLDEDLIFTENNCPEEFMSLEELKTSYVKKIVNRFDGNILKSCDILKISPQTARRLILQESVA